MNHHEISVEDFVQAFAQPGRYMRVLEGTVRELEDHDDLELLFEDVLTPDDWYYLRFPARKDDPRQRVIEMVQDHEHGLHVRPSVRKSLGEDVRDRWGNQCFDLVFAADEIFGESFKYFPRWLPFGIESYRLQGSQWLLSCFLPNGGGRIYAWMRHRHHQLALLGEWIEKYGPLLDVRLTRTSLDEFIFVDGTSGVELYPNILPWRRSSGGEQ